MQNPLQVFRYCPTCGCSGLVIEAEKLLLCKTCGFKYYINMGAAVAAIIRNKKREVLFTIRKNDPAIGLLDLPGGFVDLGETAEEALKREIREELNLEITEIQFIGTFPNIYNFGGINYQTLDLAFECITDSFSGIKAADDVEGFVFRTIKSVEKEEIGLASIKLIIEHLKHNNL